MHYASNGRGTNNGTKNLRSGADRTGIRSYIDDFFYRSQAQLTPKAILNFYSGVSTTM
jgi:hypothetical protein